MYLTEASMYLCKTKRNNPRCVKGHEMKPIFHVILRFMVNLSRYQGAAYTGTSGDVTLYLTHTGEKIKQRTHHASTNNETHTSDFNHIKLCLDYPAIHLSCAGRPLRKRSIIIKTLPPIGHPKQHVNSAEC